MLDILSIYAIPGRYAHHYPAYVHDHNLTRWADGTVRSYLHLERLSRKKYDNQLHHYVEGLLDDTPFAPTPDTEVVMVDSFVGSSVISTHGRLRIESNPAEGISTAPTPARAYWQSNAWEGYPLKAWRLSHELAHIGTCLPFFGAFRENSLLIHFDGGASQGNFSAFHYHHGRLHLLECHWELSHLSKLFNDNALSFALMQAVPGQHNSVPGKLMGYAALGTYRSTLAEWLQENNNIRDIWHDLSQFYKKASSDFGWHGSLADQHDLFLQDVAATIQGTFQQQWLEKLAKLQQNVQADHLYLAGGCALNILANTAIVESGLFRDVFIPPACNDSGLSLGAAAFLAWQRGEEIEAHSPYLNGLGLQDRYRFDTETIRQTGDLIAKGAVVGLANGPGEAGPRALGNRSLIARADSPAIARRVSMDCKRREWYRPVAPVMLASLAQQVVQRPFPEHLTRYMLYDCRIRPQFRLSLAGVIHGEDSARIQTVRHRQENPFLFDLLKYLHEAHGLLALINTSFNVQGEPIVHTPAEALASARQMKLDALVIDGTLQIFHSHELENPLSQ